MAFLNNKKTYNLLLHIKNIYNSASDWIFSGNKN